MSVRAGNPGDLERLVERDHGVLRGLLDRFDTSRLDVWGQVFRDFFEYLVRHEVAEQEVLYPALRDSVPRAGDMIELCEREEHGFVVRIGIMEALDPCDLEFREQLGFLREEVLAHLAHEEQVVIPMLRGHAGHDVEELGSSYEVVRMTAPTEPTAVESALMAEGTTTSAGEAGSARETGSHGLSRLADRLWRR